MIHLITRENTHLYKDVMTQMFALRHKVFVENRGWDLQSEGGLERDEFDTIETAYLVKVLEDGTVAGAMRMLPSTQPHVLSDVFPALVNGDVPRNRSTWESSRGCVQSEFGGQTVFADLNVAMIEFALIWGIEAITFVLDTDLFPAALAVGWNLKPLGLPQEMNDESYTAGILHVTPETLKIVREVTGIHRQVLHFNCPADQTVKVA